MTNWKSLLASVALALAAFASSTQSLANNYQDLWWNPNESGWGINISQQGDVMFATWFIYGADNQPTWIFLSRADRSGATGNTFSGDIFRATGTPFAVVPFIPANTAATKVGTATLVFSDSRTGTLTYTVNGAQVVKQITRQVIGLYNLTGSYFGALKRAGVGCVNAALNGDATNPAIYSVSHSIATGSLTITEVGGSLCNFTGTTSVFGSLIEGSGNFTCAAENITGSWTMREGRPGPNAFSALMSLRPNGDSCTLSATIGGLKP
ncbi:MAG: hypothetical protein ABI583_11120 [Betaproteobacteria bacterium]